MRVYECFFKLLIKRPLILFLFSFFGFVVRVWDAEQLMVDFSGALMYIYNSCISFFFLGFFYNLRREPSPRERDHFLYLHYCENICNIWICIIYVAYFFSITFCMQSNLFCNGIPFDAKGTVPLLLWFNLVVWAYSCYAVFLKLVLCVPEFIALMYLLVHLTLRPCFLFGFLLFLYTIILHHSPNHWPMYFDAFPYVENFVDWYWIGWVLVLDHLEFAEGQFGLD